MGARGGIFIPIVGDEADLVAALRKAEAELLKLGPAAQRGAGQARGALSRLGATGGMLKNKLLGPLKGLGPALGTAAVLKFGKDSVAAFGEAEVANVEMSNSIKNNKLLAGESADSFAALATKIQAKTRADDESILSGAAVLANFKLTGDQIKTTLPLVVDFARKTGRNVPAASKLIGKAMLGNTKALKDLGIVYKTTGDPAKDFTNITGLLASKVGGFAEKEGKTSAGQLDIMKNKFNDLQEVVGGKLIGVFGFLTDHLNIIGPLIGVVAAGIVAYKIVTLGAAITTTLFGQAAGAAWLAAAAPIAILVAAVAGVGFVIFKFRKQIVGALLAVGRFFGRIFGSIGAGLAAFGRFTMNVLSAPIRFVVGVWKFQLGLIVGAFKWLKDKASNIWTALKDGFKRAAIFIGNVFKAPINLIIGALNFLIRGLNSIKITVPAWVPGIGGKGFGFSIPQIPKLDTGGTVLETGLAVVHKGEDWSGVGSARRSGGAQIVVNVNVAGSVAAERDIARTIRDELVKVIKRNGSLGLGSI